MGIPLKIVVLSTLVTTLCAGLACNKVKAQTERRIYEDITTTVALAAIPSRDALDLWIDTLSEAESENRANIRVLDTNGKYSYGCLQFQMGTWLGYGKDAGATVENIYNCALQRKVAKAMLTNQYRNWHHWGYTVLKKGGVGLPPQ